MKKNNKVMLIIIVIVFIALIVYGILTRQDGELVSKKDDLNVVTTSKEFTIVNKIMNDYLLNLSLDNHEYVKNVTGNANVKIQNNVSVYTGVICEDDVFLGPSCVFTNVINPRSFISRKDEYRKTIIGKGASIGANATIVCGHNIGKYAFVGAGSVVTHDIPDYALVVGNPARLKYYVCECSEKMIFDNNSQFTCQKCGNKYIMVDGEVKKL